MNKSALLAVSLWAVGLGSAAALAVAVRRPHVAVAVPAVIPIDRAPSLVDPPPPPPRLAVETRIEVAPIVVSGTEPRRRTLPRDSSEMRCGPWEGLLQGPQTAEVRRCD
jgi:hypothetical protein